MTSNQRANVCHNASFTIYSFVNFKLHIAVLRFFYILCTLQIKVDTT